MDIGLPLRTDDNNKRSLVHRKETVEYITVKVKFSLVKRISVVGRSGTVARPRKRRRSGNRRWRHCTCAEILHEHSIGTEERANAQTRNVDNMTAKQLCSDPSESQTFGPESSGLGTAALAKRCTVAASIGIGNDASDGDDDGPRRPVKKRAADRACGALVLARPEPVDDGSASSGCEKQGTKASSRCTPRKADVKGDYSLSEDDKDESEEFPEFIGGRMAKCYDFTTGFVKLFFL